MPLPPPTLHLVSGLHFTGPSGSISFTDSNSSSNRFYPWLCSGGGPIPNPPSFQISASGAAFWLGQNILYANATLDFNANGTTGPCGSGNVVNNEVVFANPVTSTGFELSGKEALEKTITWDLASLGGEPDWGLWLNVYVTVKSPDLSAPLSSTTYAIVLIIPSPG
jgi:hypothetical protein